MPATLGLGHRIGIDPKATRPASTVAPTASASGTRRSLKRSPNLVSIHMEGTSIPHMVQGHFGASTVVLIPAGPGTGVIAGSSVRAVCEACGIRDILTKSLGSSNPINLVKAAIDGLKQLRTKHDVERLRGVSLT